MSDDRGQLTTLVSAQTGAGAAQVQSRVESVEDGVRTQADAARHTALYLAMWTVFALLFGAYVAVVATIHALARSIGLKKPRFHPRSRLAELPMPAFVIPTHIAARFSLFVVAMRHPIRRSIKELREKRRLARAAATEVGRPGD
jgi:hypothetical protein